MGKPAARLTDMHVCAMVTGTTPHVGGPISAPGVPTVLIGGMPAAVVGDMCVCTGPPDAIAMGSAGVMIGGKPAARLGDMTVHGGAIIAGCPTVLIGEVCPGAPSLGMMEAALAGAVNASFPASSAVAGAIAGAAPPVPPPLVGPMTGAEASRPQNQTRERSWFHAHVRYDDGTPAPRVAFTLTLPDGSVRTGETDDQGMVREGGLPAVDCEFALVDHDGESWVKK